jgi:fluoride exporter
MTWWEWVLLVLAGAVGAPLRYVVDTLVTDRTQKAFPWGTMFVNVSGSFVLGLLTGMVLYHGLGLAPRMIVGTGLIGAYTTYSTFSFETIVLVEDGEIRAVLANVAGSLVAGTLAAALGLGLAGL